MEAGDAPVDALAYPGRGVVEDGGRYTADFCDEEVAGAWEECEGGGLGEGGAEEGLSRAVVRGGVEGEEAGVQSVLDDGDGGEDVGGVVVLVVEGGGAEDERGDALGDGRVRGLGWGRGHFWGGLERYRRWVN